MKKPGKSTNRLLLFALVFHFLVPGTPKDMLTYISRGVSRLRCHAFWSSPFRAIPSIITGTMAGDVTGGEVDVTALISQLQKSPELAKPWPM